MTIQITVRSLIKPFHAPRFPYFFTLLLFINENHTSPPSLRIKKRKKISSALRLALTAPSQSNQTWAMDFVSDALANGRRFRYLNIIDVYTRECLRIDTDTSINGMRVTKTLDILIELRSLPEIRYTV